MMRIKQFSVTKPNTPVLEAPKLDEEVKEQLRNKGKDPHFGQEKFLLKLQESLLDVSGPLMGRSD